MLFANFSFSGISQIIDTKLGYFFIAFLSIKFESNPPLKNIPTGTSTS